MVGGESQKSNASREIRSYPGGGCFRRNLDSFPINRKGKTRHAAHASLARHHLLGIPFSSSSFQEGALLK